MSFVFGTHRIAAVIGQQPVPVLYLDLDGTVRWGKDELGRFVNSSEDVIIFDEVPRLLATYKQLGWRIVGCSNQGGLALGLMTMEDCAAAMVATYEKCNRLFDKLIWCQHHPDAEDPEYAVCWCRKPRSGMVIEAALSMNDEHDDERYPPYLGLFVGDRPEDEACAENAGLRFMAASDWRRGEHIRELSEPIKEN